MAYFFKHTEITLIALLVISVSFTSCRKTENQNDCTGFDSQVEASLKDLENRKKYKFFTPQIIKSIPDDRLEMAILDYIADVKIKDNYDNEYVIIKRLSKGFQYIYITWDLESEVNNGGFIQYFYNTSGKFNTELAEAFQNIRAYKTEKIVIDAITLYNKERAIHKNTGQDGVFTDLKNESVFNRLDDIFYKTGEDLSKLRIRYIRDNTAEFITK